MENSMASVINKCNYFFYHKVDSHENNIVRLNTMYTRQIFGIW